MPNLDIYRGQNEYNSVYVLYTGKAVLYRQVGSLKSKLSFGIVNLFNKLIYLIFWFITVFVFLYLIMGSATNWHLKIEQLTFLVFLRSLVLYSLIEVTENKLFFIWIMLKKLTYKYVVCAISPEMPRGNIGLSMYVRYMVHLCICFLYLHICVPA